MINSIAVDLNTCSFIGRQTNCFDTPTARFVGSIA